VQRKFLSLSLAVLAFFSLLISGCTKIDTTELGADLIPAVDNVHTFADTFQVFGTMETNPDTVTRVSASENHVVGRVNDPVFGKTNADLFLQLTPDFFPYYYGDGDTLIGSVLVPGTRFDSVFLCLAYKGYYGDTNALQNLQVYALDPATSNFKDSSYKVNFQPDASYQGNLLGQASVKASELNNPFSIRHGKDTITHQIRIKLSNNFLTLLNSMDTTGTQNAYRSDSLFKTFFKGFAVVSDNSVTGVGGLFYVSLTDPLTRLEVHYTTKKGATKDTAFSSFTFSTGSTQTSIGAQANYIKRDNAGSEYAGSPAPDALYVQSAPGSSVKLTIPDLTHYPNRIIHRAEIILEQIPGDAMVDKWLTPPAYLYLDLIDTPATAARFKPIYYDLSPNTFYAPDDAVSFFPTGGIDYTYFGGFARSMTDAFGTRTYYTFNLTRYVQNMITKGGTNYALRLTAPYKLNYNGLNFLYSNALAAGRVKLANYNHNNYKLRMRIVYSNL
jgi:hypothetical protein